VCGKCYIQSQVLSSEICLSLSIEKKQMVNAWELIQKKSKFSILSNLCRHIHSYHVILAFTKWVNNKLDLKNIPNIVHLNEDLANGVRLIQLLVRLPSANYHFLCAHPFF